MREEKVNIDEEDIVKELKRLADEQARVSLLTPPGGRFKAMAAEAGKRRSKRFLRETLVFLGIALAMLGVEALLLNASLLLFGLLQVIGLTAGILWFIASGVLRHEEVDRS